MPGGLIRLRGRRRQRGSQAERHRAEIGEEGGDDVPVLGTAKRPPKLEVATQFKDCVSRTTKGHLLNNKLITDVPKRPGKNPYAQPSNMAVAGRAGVKLGKQVGEVGITPLSTNRFMEAGPKELGRVAREKDVVSILNGATDGAPPITRAIPLEDLNTRGEPATDPLP